MRAERSAETVRGRKQTKPDTFYTPNELRDTLPQVGDWLRKTPTLKKEKDVKPVPLRCQVVYVNPDHMWYTVQFRTAMGHTFRESYKAPENHAGARKRGGKNGQS